jgi:hypothetical protein
MTTVQNERVRNLNEADVNDRGWTEREVYGKVRYMSAGGLERKAKPGQYVEKIEERMETCG